MMVLNKNTERKELLLTGRGGGEIRIEDDKLYGWLLCTMVGI